MMIIAEIGPHCAIVGSRITKAMAVAITVDALPRMKTRGALRYGARLEIARASPNGAHQSSMERSVPAYPIADTISPVPAMTTVAVPSSQPSCGRSALAITNTATQGAAQSTTASGCSHGMVVSNQVGIRNAPYSTIRPARTRGTTRPVNQLRGSSCCGETAK
jgi:hypothetical protein